MGIATCLALALVSTAGPQKLAAMDIQAREGVTTGLAQIVTEEVVAHLRKGAPKVSVIAAEDIRSLIGFQAQKLNLGCQDTACLAEIGGALGVDELVVGSLAKLGESYLSDTNNATVWALTGP